MCRGYVRGLGLGHLRLLRGWDLFQWQRRRELQSVWPGLLRIDYGCDNLRRLLRWHLPREFGWVKLRKLWGRLLFGDYRQRMCGVLYRRLPTGLGRLHLRWVQRWHVFGHSQRCGFFGLYFV